MKNLKALLLALGMVCLISSCNPKAGEAVTKPTEESKAPMPAILITQEKLKAYLGANYYSNSYVKALHPLNSSTVTYTANGSSVKTETELTANGSLKVTEDELKLAIMATLPAGTEGQIDSITRDKNKDIEAFKIGYVIKDVGPCSIWYYRVDNSLDGQHPYKCNRTGKREIEGISVVRNSEENYLKLDFSKKWDSKTLTKSYEIISPFTQGVEIKKTGRVEEEKEKQ